MTAWIRVEDRLPPERQDVLICFGKDAACVHVGWFCNSTWFGAGLTAIKVTHWMPMPAPPSEGQP